MYRACSTWQYEVVAHLVEQRWHGERLGYLSAETYATTDDSFSGIRERGRRGRDTWRALKSHEGGRSFARALRSGRALAVYAFRDLATWCFPDAQAGRLVSGIAPPGDDPPVPGKRPFWRAQPACSSSATKIFADPVSRGPPDRAASPGACACRAVRREIADEYSLASNQARIDSLLQRLQEAGSTSRTRQSQICDPTTLLHWNHLGPGGAGSWYDRASARQRIHAGPDLWRLAGAERLWNAIAPTSPGPKPAVSIVPSQLLIRPGGAVALSS